MKGRLTATSDGPGRGATFTLELPAEADEAAATEAQFVSAFPKEVPPACQAA
jgi:hypothetical protein